LSATGPAENSITLSGPVLTTFCSQAINFMNLQQELTDLNPEIWSSTNKGTNVNSRCNLLPDTSYYFHIVDCFGLVQQRNLLAAKIETNREKDSGTSEKLFLMLTFQTTECI
jgi:hypothetical protein